jgi:hypothetical protein
LAEGLAGDLEDWPGTSAAMTTRQITRSNFSKSGRTIRIIFDPPEQDEMPRLKMADSAPVSQLKFLPGSLSVSCCTL